MARTPKTKQRAIYNRLRVLRAELGISRVDLAERVGVNPQTIGAIERGDHYPSLDLAMSIGEVFALPVEAVFSREPIVYSPDAYRPKPSGGHTKPSALEVSTDQLGHLSEEPTA
jgi:putative transcriptional regulator